LVIAANGVVYAMVSYAAVFILLVVVAAEKIRLAMIWLVFPVAFLIGLVCIPRFDPLWPRGMTELTRQEKALQDAIPMGTGIEGARTVLHSFRSRLKHLRRLC
jgi:hypothetical protein